MNRIRKESRTIQKKHFKLDRSRSHSKTVHPVTCFAMRITAGNDAVVYSADSSYIPEFIPFTKDADLFILSVICMHIKRLQKQGI